MERESGILMAVSSLNGMYSIGSFGREAKKFIDYLYNNGFTWWQILPICIPDRLNSPYNSPSIYSINPFLIDLETIYEQGLITKDELKNEQTKNTGKCNYSILYQTRLRLLYRAYIRFSNNQTLTDFSKNKHIFEFCKFQALCQINGHNNWKIWKINTVAKEYVDFWLFLQYEGYRQYFELKKYANLNGVRIMGDLPMYSSFYSSDVYFYPEYYQLDNELEPLFISGAKPDGFSSVGQCWGHPVYDWHRISKDGYIFWLDRITHMSNMFDGIRLDHFRGFESYWAIPASSLNALNGFYKPGPGKAFFTKAQPYIYNKIVVGEDLGVTSEKVKELIDMFGFSEMRVIQYIFEDNNEKDSPENYTKKCIAYTGTHDNQTLVGFLSSLSDVNRKCLEKKMNKKEDETLYESIIRNMYQSKAGILIFPIQDVLKLDNKYVLNNHIPSKNNWTFRINDDYIKNNIELFSMYNRKELKNL